MKLRLVGQTTQLLRRSNLIKPPFELSEEEIKALYDYFYKAGYVSYEFHPLIILLIKKLANHIGGGE